MHKSYVIWGDGMNRPVYRPDYGRVLLAYLTRRHVTRHDKRINFDPEAGMTCPWRSIAARAAIKARQLARNKGPVEVSRRIELTGVSKLLNLTIVLRPAYT